jgi:chromosome segregation ATPase
MEASDSRTAAADAALLLDRIVSASTSQDMVSSLEAIEDALKARTLDPKEIVRADEDSSILPVLLTLIQTSQWRDLPVEDAPTLVTRVYHTLTTLTTSSSPQQDAKEICDTLLRQPSPGRWLEALIDVSCSSGSAGATQGLATVSPYARVMALQIIEHTARTSPKITQTQLLQAPNGLHRLGDLLQPAPIAQPGDAFDRALYDEQVRNQALLLAATLSRWSAVAKVWMFDEVGDVVAQLAIQEGGLTGGNVIVLDCVQLLAQLLSHDAALADLVLQSPTLGPNLARLLDLRQATQFQSPTSTGTRESTKTLGNVPSTSDDLDDLLATPDPKVSTLQSQEEVSSKIIVPRLTPPEEKIVTAVLDILAVVLESEAVRNVVWTKQKPLVSLVWELALIAPPPPNSPYPCAVPSITLQQRALHVTALYLNNRDTLDRHNGVDRLLYLVCTGGMGTRLDQRLAISFSALHVLRRTLGDTQTHEMLLHTLAPPMEDVSMDDENDEAGATPRGPKPPLTVVPKLLNTIFENLHLLDSDSGDRHAQERRKVFLAGALGGLSLFATDEASRSMMLRFSSPDGKSLLEALMEALEAEAEITDKSSQNDDFIRLVIMRFLAHWITEAPMVVHALLSSPHSTMLTEMVSGKSRVAVLTSLLLGLAMEHLNDESQCGGWTRSGLLETFAQRGGGISKFMNRLESFKTETDLPWSGCALEKRTWDTWYDKSVLMVRKRVVQELTLSGDDSDEGDAEDRESEIGPDSKDDHDSRGNARMLQRIVAQQAAEIELLRDAVTESKLQLNLQENQLSVWERRMESTPTELDTLLNEYTARNAELDGRVAMLEDELRRKDEAYQRELASRDGQIGAVEKELDDTMAREVEAREERDSLREDMTALSQAYSSLEEEFRRQSEQSQRALSTPGNEENRQAPDGMAEPNTTGGTEVATLRAENSRLRDDARAADEWMTMAVERMNNMGAVNAALEQQSLALKEELERAVADLSSSDANATEVLLHEKQLFENKLCDLRASLQGELAESTQRCKELEIEVSDKASQLHEANERAAMTAEYVDQLTFLKTSLEEEVLALQEQNRRTNADALTGDASLIARLEAELSEVQSSSDKKLEEMRNHCETLDFNVAEAADNSAKLQKADEWMAMATERMDKVTSANQALEAEVLSLRGQLVVATNQEDIFSPDHDQITKTVLEEELARQRMFFEAKIIELENRYGAFDSKAITDESAANITKGNQPEIQKEFANAEAEIIREISLLKQSNNELQRIENEASSLAEERDQLQGFAKELSEDALSSEQQASQADELAHLRSELASVANREQSEIYKRESRIRALEARLDGGLGVYTVEDILSREAEISQLREANEAAQEWMAKAVEHHRLLSDQVGSLSQEVSALNCKLRQRDETDPASSQISGISAPEVEDRIRVAVEQLHKDLDDRIAHIASMEIDIAALKRQLREKEHIETALKKAESEINRREEAIRQLYLQLEDYSEQRNEVSKLKAERDSLRGQLEASSSEILILLSRVSGIESMEGDLAVKDLEIARLESSIEKLQRNLYTQDPGLSESDEASKSLVEGSRLRSRVVESEELLQSSSESADSQQQEDRITELESRLESLRQQLEDQEADASNVISEWQQSYAVLETEKIELESRLSTAENVAAGELSSEKHTLPEEVDRLRSRVLELEELLQASSESADSQQQEDRVTELESRLESLRQQLEDQEADASNVISEWQQSYAILEEALVSLRNGVQPPEKECAQEISSLRGRIEVSEAERKQLDERMVELKLTIQGLEDQLREQEKDTSTVIGQWQARYSDLQGRREEVETRLEKALFDAESISRTERDLSEEVSFLRKQVCLLEAAAEDTASHLLAADLRIKDYSLLQEGHQEAEIKIAALAQAEGKLLKVIEHLKEKLAASDHEANIEKLQLKEKLKERETSKEFLERELLQKKKEIEEAAFVLSLREDELSTLNDELSTLKDEYSVAGKSLKATEEKMVVFQEIASREQESNEALQRNFERQATELRSEVNCLSEKLDRGETSYRALEQKNESLENELSDTRDSLDKEKKRSTELQAKLVALTQQCDSLSVDLNLATTDKSDENSILSAGLDAEHLRVVDLQQTIQEYDIQLCEERKEAEAVIAEWEACCNQLEEKTLEQQTKIQEITAERDKALCVLSVLETETATNCKRDTASLYNAEPKYGQPQPKESWPPVNEENSERRSDVASVKDNVAFDKMANEEETRDAEVEIQALMVESEEVVSQWKDRVEKVEAVERNLKAAIKALEDELETQAVEANDAISSWERQFMDAEHRNRELEARLAAIQSVDEMKDMPLRQELQKERSKRLTVEASLAALQGKAEQSAEHFASRLDSGVAEHSRANECVEAQRLIERSQLEELVRERDDLRSSRARIEQERDTLRTHAGELEDEIQQAKDALRLLTTNEISEKATASAAQALRQQVDELRELLEMQEETIADEQKKREDAEIEARRLRSDMAALLGMEDTEDNMSEIQRQTLDATANFQRRERLEMEELKAALTRTLDELDYARRTEEEVKERVSRMDLQVTVYEQEIVASKADLKAMNETIKELRGRESTCRSSLEHRIASLENDKGVLNRAHAAEIENLQNALTQLHMERDRLFQSLKESERSNEALVQASSAGDRSLSESFRGDEVVQLQLEKAQLLSSIAKERSRAEHRLRETREAANASAESDVILERELRHASEMALANVKQELRDLRLEQERILAARSSPARVIDDAEMSKLSEELATLKSHVQASKKDNDDLRSYLDDANSKIKKLTEECRDAKMRASQLEREGRYEAQVRAEFARLQAADSVRDSPSVVLGENPAESSDDEAENRSTKAKQSYAQTSQLYDEIQQQKEAIEEERNMYFELLAEHDDLLALLAQHDLVRTSLHEALSQTGGPEAVENAIRSAEEKAISQYGKFVKLT